ncbi:MAG: hypothetical protein PVF46_03490 [Lysobacterales bacterium]|jgi:hypothetical protein
MRFLKSRYVLMLLLAIALVEILFRIGLYEPVVSPYSHSGTTITLKRALREFGRDRVQVATFGDSRTSQGLDNERIYEAGREAGLNHLKLSMAGSHFLTYKALASWSLAELEALRGIVIAISPASFAYRGNGAYELAKVMPLRNDISMRVMFEHAPFRRADIRTFAPLFSIAGYREDIKDLLADPAGRLAAVTGRNGRPPLNILAYAGREEADICAVPVDDPAACLQSLQEADTAVGDRARSGLKKLCEAALKGNERSGPSPAAQALANEWVSFLEGLSSRVRVMLVILPEYGPYARHLYHPNSMFVYEDILKRLDEKGVVDVVDLYTVISEQDEPECGFYLDSTHLNLPGKQVVTDALLPALEVFWDSLQAPGAVTDRG